MDGAAVAVEEPGFGERVGARAEGPEGQALAGEAAQQVDEPLIDRMRHIDAAADEQDVERRRVLDSGGRRHA